MSFPADGATFIVQTGENLHADETATDPCDDLLSVDTSRVRAHTYQATAGSAELRVSGSTVTATVEALVLEADGVPAVEIASFEFPPVELLPATAM